MTGVDNEKPSPVQSTMSRRGFLQNIGKGSFGLAIGFNNDRYPGTSIKKIMKSVEVAGEMTEYARVTASIKRFIDNTPDDQIFLQIKPGESYPWPEDVAVYIDKLGEEIEQIAIKTFGTQKKKLEVYPYVPDLHKHAFEKSAGSCPEFPLNADGIYQDKSDTLAEGSYINFKGTRGRDWPRILAHEKGHDIYTQLGEKNFSYLKDLFDGDAEYVAHIPSSVMEYLFRVSRGWAQSSDGSGFTTPQTEPGYFLPRSFEELLVAKCPSFFAEFFAKVKSGVFDTPTFPKPEVTRAVAEQILPGFNKLWELWYKTDMLKRQSVVASLL